MKLLRTRRKILTWKRLWLYPSCDRKTHFTISIVYSSTNKVSPWENITGMPVITISSHATPIDLRRKLPHYSFFILLLARSLSRSLLTAAHYVQCEKKCLIWDERLLEICPRTSEQVYKHSHDTSPRSYTEPSLFKAVSERWNRAWWWLHKNREPNRREIEKI